MSSPASGSGTKEIILNLSLGQTLSLKYRVTLVWAEARHKLGYQG
jgi:hypothetical protein